jgi:repressor LexA
VYTTTMNRTDKKDQKGYLFIRNQIVHSGITPSLRDIAKAVGYSSPRSVQLMLDRLEKQRLLKRVNGVIRLSRRQSRSSAERVIEVPLVGSVACGAPSLAEQTAEALIQVSTKIARPGNTYFLLRAQGTSMNRAGIQDGDLVLVRQQPSAENGEKVVALINDDATIKRFYREGDVVVLRPDSTDKSHKPIVVSEDFSIQGVVVVALPAGLY